MQNGWLNHNQVLETPPGGLYHTLDSKKTLLAEGKAGPPGRACPMALGRSLVPRGGLSSRGRMNYGKERVSAAAERSSHLLDKGKKADPPGSEAPSLLQFWSCRHVNVTLDLGTSSSSFCSQCHQQVEETLFLYLCYIHLLAFFLKSKNARNSLNFCPTKHSTSKENEFLKWNRHCWCSGWLLGWKGLCLKKTVVINAVLRGDCHGCAVRTRSLSVETGFCRLLSSEHDAPQPSDPSGPFPRVGSRSLFSLHCPSRDTLRCPSLITHSFCFSFTFHECRLWFLSAAPTAKFKTALIQVCWKVPFAPAFAGRTHRFGLCSVTVDMAVEVGLKRPLHRVSAIGRNTGLGLGKSRTRWGWAALLPSWAHRYCPSRTSPTGDRVLVPQSVPVRVESRLRFWWV